MSVSIIDILKQKNSGVFPVADSNDLLGGYYSVADSIERLAIPSGRRRFGMLVFQQDTQQTWVLGGALDNNSWASASNNLGGQAVSDITLAVSSTGNDSNTTRPSLITGGDWTSKPFLTVQAAIDAAVRVLKNYSLRIDIGAGDFAGFAARGFVGQFAGILVRGTYSLATLASGPNDFNAGTGTNATTLKRNGGSAWVTNALRGMVVKALNGAGATDSIFNEGAAIILSNDGDTAVLGGASGLYLLAAGDHVQICKRATRIATGLTDPALFGSKSLCSLFGNVSDVVLSRLDFDATDDSLYGLTSSSNGCQVAMEFCRLGPNVFHYLTNDTFHYWNSPYIADGSSVYLDGVRLVTGYGATIDGAGLVNVSKFGSATFDYADAQNCSNNAITFEKGNALIIGANAQGCTAIPLVLKNINNTKLGMAGLTGANAGASHGVSMSDSGQYAISGAAMTGAADVLIEGDTTLSYAQLAANGVSRRRLTSIHWGSGREVLYQKFTVATQGGDEFATNDAQIGGRIKHYGKMTLLNASPTTVGAQLEVTATGSDLAGAKDAAYGVTVIVGGAEDTGVKIQSSGVGIGDGGVPSRILNLSGTRKKIYPPTTLGILNSGVAGTALNLEDGCTMIIDSRGDVDAYCFVVDGNSLSTLERLMWFGDGSDGDVSVTTAITLSRNMYYNNLTLSGSAAINTNGFYVYVKNQLDLTNAPANAINWSAVGLAGVNASGSTGGAYGVANTLHSLRTGIGSTVATVMAPLGGSMGITGPSHAGSNGNAAGPVVLVSSYGEYFGGVGGLGGAGGASSVAASLGAGTWSGFVVPQGQLFVTPELPTYANTSAISPGTSRPIAAGLAGMGGGGGRTNTGTGGGGGSGSAGGGFVVVNARIIKRSSSTTTAGAIASIGATGATGAAGTTTSGGGAGGGGGGGGLVRIAYEMLTGTAKTALVDVSGGVGGAAGAGGGSGGFGGAGGQGGGGGVIQLLNIRTGAIAVSRGSTSGGTAGTSTGTATAGTGGAGETLQATL